LREFGHRALGMVGDEAHVVGEERLVMLVHAGGDVRPPEEGLRVAAAIVEADFQFEIGAPGAQADAMHTLHARHGIVIATPHGDGAIGFAFDGYFDGEKSCRAMMLRPVELDSTGDPRASEADKCGLDDVLAIEEIVAVDLVVSDVDAATDFGQDHDAQVLVFEMHRLPRVFAGCGRNTVDDRKGIDFAAAALVDALFKKEWIGVGVGGQVGLHDNRLLPGLDGAGFAVGRRG